MILDESLFEKKEPSLYNKVYDNLEKLGYDIFASTDINGLEISKKNEKNLQRAKDWLDQNNIKYNTKKFLNRFYLQIPTELTEDIEKTKSGKWVNKGKEGPHGEFKTKKAAREQQKAMFASGWKGESLEENADRDSIKHDFEDFYDQFDIKPERKIKEVYAEMFPEEYQLDKIHPAKTIADIWSEMQAGEDFYRIASTDGEGFDSAVREGIFEIISKAFKIPYNTVYLTWINDGKLKETFKVVDKYGKKVPQGGGFTSRKQAEMFTIQYGEKDLKVVKESFEDEHLGVKENIGSDIAEYQKWVDYDMEKYGRISDDTNEKIRKAGLTIVKDKYNDYEVIANEPIKENADIELIRKFYNEKTPKNRMELNRKLKQLGLKHGVSGVSSGDLEWVELNGKRYEVKKTNKGYSVKQLNEFKESTKTYRSKNKSIKEELDQNWFYTYQALKNVGSVQDYSKEFEFEDDAINFAKDHDYERVVKYYYPIIDDPDETWNFEDYVNYGHPKYDEEIWNYALDEKLENNEIDDFFNKAKKLGVKNLKDLKMLLDDPTAVGKTDKEKMDNYYKEANPEDKNLNEAVDTKLSLFINAINDLAGDFSLDLDNLTSKNDITHEAGGYYIAATDDLIDFGKEWEGYFGKLSHTVLDDIKNMVDDKMSIGQILKNLKIKATQNLNEKFEVTDNYIYLFPKLKDEDLKELSNYNLKFLGINDRINYVVKGLKQDLEQYASDYLDYQLHPDYLYLEDDFAGEIVTEDLSMTSKTIDNSKINFDIKDNGDFTFSVNGKEYKGHTDKPEEMSKDMKDFGFSLNEDLNTEQSEVVLKPEENGITQMLIDAINGE